MFNNNIFDVDRSNCSRINNNNNLNHEFNQKTMSQKLPKTMHIPLHVNQNKHIRPNIPLLIIDLLLLPIHIFRMVLIYFFGSKYNLKGFTFLDVIMHADKPYFNQEDCRLINTMGDDYRIVIRDDSRIFPMDLNNYFSSSHHNCCSQCSCARNSSVKNEDRVIVGDISSGDSSSSNSNSSNLNSGIWNISTDAFENDKNNKNDSDDDNENEDNDDTDDTDSESETGSELDSNIHDNRIKIKGVNYFEADDEPDNKLNYVNSFKNDILDSIRDELNSAFED